MAAKHVKLMTRIRTKVTPLDLLRGRLRYRKWSLSLGWCGPFPPSACGGAAVIGWFVKAISNLAPDIDLAAIPTSGVIDKRLFRNIRITTLRDPHLDVIVYYCAREYYVSMKKYIKAKNIIYQPYHGYLDEVSGIVSDTCEAELLMAPTKWARKEYISVGAKNVAYVPHGVDTEKFSPLKQKDSFEILFVSRLCFYKGIIQFLKMVPLVLDIYPQVIFRIHGVLDNTDLVYPYPDGENRSIYEEVVNLLKITRGKYSHNLKLIDTWVDYNKAYEIYHNADVLVFPSNNEGFGMPMIESMSCGIPCIVADKPPMNEIVIDGKTGFCLPTYKEDNSHGMDFPRPEDIAEKIVWIIENPSKYAEMKSAARMRAVNEYELGKCAANMIRLVKRVACL